MVRLDPRIDDHWSLAAPVLETGECANTINIMRRIASREAHPYKIVERGRNEVAVITNDDHYDPFCHLLLQRQLLVQFAHLLPCALIIRESVGLKGKHTGHGDLRIAEVAY